MGIASTTPETTVGHVVIDRLLHPPVAAKWTTTDLTRPARTKLAFW
jgi:hypothetical protein